MNTPQHKSFVSDEKVAELVQRFTLSLLPVEAVHCFCMEFEKAVIEGIAGYAAKHHLKGSSDVDSA
jgi:hypothetical protein